MSAISPSPHEPRPRLPEYDDPHYHDEEVEIQNDEERRRRATADARRKALRQLNATHRYEE